MNRGIRPKRKKEKKEKEEKEEKEKKEKKEKKEGACGIIAVLELRLGVLLQFVCRGPIFLTGVLSEIYGYSILRGTVLFMTV